MKKLFLSFMLLFSLQITAQINDSIISIGKRITIQSKILGETRQVLIAAPENPSPKPLILVFDGESLFIPVTSALRFMNYSSEIPQAPEAIVVAIPNTDRMRDMPVPQQYETVKGHENFMKFITTELLPYLQTKYSLNGHILTIGHSQGGLFVSYLLAKDTKVFPWAIAIDAPMTVDESLKSLKESINNVIKQKDSKTRYISAESLFGWEDSFEKYLPANENVKKVNMKDESHESIPFKAIYEGLKFLYHDFAPVRKNLKLGELRLHYQFLSETYGYPYEIPLRVLLASAARKKPENRKAEILELLQYAEEKYGTNSRISKLKEEALKITKEPDPLMDYYLSLPKPAPQQVQKYLGRWVGLLIVPGGQNMLMDMEIIAENGKTKLLSVLPWDTTKKEEPEIFHIDKDGKLIFGRRNRGAGLIISIAELNNKGNLAGKEDWIGFSIPDDVPADIKERMQFTLNNPNTFDLKKRK